MDLLELKYCNSKQSEIFIHYVIDLNRISLIIYNSIDNNYKKIFEYPI